MQARTFAPLSPPLPSPSFFLSCLSSPLLCSRHGTRHPVPQHGRSSLLRARRRPTGDPAPARGARHFERAGGTRL